MTRARKKILVVDDSETVRSQAKQILSADYDCIFATNGREGLELALREAPDAILSDLEMPVMDGVALLRALRADPRTQSTPLVIVTTVTAVDRVNECRTLGCSGFVLKPLVKEYVLAKLGTLLRRTA